MGHPQIAPQAAKMDREGCFCKNTLPGPLPKNSNDCAGSSACENCADPDRPAATKAHIKRYAEGILYVTPEPKRPAPKPAKKVYRPDALQKIDRFADKHRSGYKPLSQRLLEMAGPAQVRPGAGHIRPARFLRAVHYAQNVENGVSSQANRQGQPSLLPVRV